VAQLGARARDRSGAAESDAAESVAFPNGFESGSKPSDWLSVGRLQACHADPAQAPP
jgi:hypothetical protein